MSSTRGNQYRPDYLVAPGEILEEYLENLCMTQVELGERRRFAKKRVDEIIEGKARITPEIARKLESVLGRPAHFWSNLERQYREDRRIRTHQVAEI